MKISRSRCRKMVPCMWVKFSSSSNWVKWSFHLVAALRWPGRHFRSCQNTKLGSLAAILTQLDTETTTFSFCQTWRNASLTSSADISKFRTNEITMRTFTKTNGVVGLNVSSVDALCPRNSLATILALLVQIPCLKRQSLTSFVSKCKAWETSTPTWTSLMTSNCLSLSNSAYMACLSK